MCCQCAFTALFVFLPSLSCVATRARPMKPTKYATIEAGEKESIGTVRFSPTGDSLGYIISGKTIAAWDVKTKQQRELLHKPGTVFLDMAYSPDGHMLAVSEFAKIYHLDAQTGEHTFLHRHGTDV